jgi:hypothetical protein
MAGACVGRGAARALDCAKKYVDNARRKHARDDAAGAKASGGLLSIVDTLCDVL